MREKGYRAVLRGFLVCSAFLLLAIQLTYSVLGRDDAKKDSTSHSAWESQAKTALPMYPQGDTKRNTAGDTIKEQQLELLAASAVLVDGDNGRVLYEKNGYEERAMASTTKIMTLLVALKYGNMEDQVEVSAYAASMPDVQLNIRKGETYYLKDLLYSLMLESHNDSAVAIAEHVGGSVEGFAGMMNEMAYDIGAYHTHFVTPNGLDDENHYSTAYDLALIARQAVEIPEFIEITNTKSYSFSDVAGNRSFTVNNHNAFLNMYSGAIGVKTGFTGNAGYCFVGAVEKDGHKMLAVVLACGWPPHKTYKWKDMRTLFDYGFSQYQLQTVYEAQPQAAAVYIENGIESDMCYGYTEENIALYMRQGEAVDYVWNVPERIEAPVSEGEIIGSVDVVINDSFYRRVFVRADRTVNPVTFRYVFREILKKFCCGKGAYLS